MGGSNWRVAVLPFILAPLMLGRVAWPLWGGPETSAVDWLLLVVSLVPWGFLVVWLRRPTSYQG